MAEGGAGLSSPTLALSAAGLVFTSTGDKATFAIPFKCQVVRVSVCVNAIPGDAGIVTFDRRITAGSDTGRVDAYAGTLNMLTSHTAGKVIYKDPTASLVLQEGDEIVVEVTDASAAVTLAHAVVLIREMPEQAGNNADMILTT